MSVISPLHIVGPVGAPGAQPRPKIDAQMIARLAAQQLDVLARAAAVCDACGGPVANVDPRRTFAIGKRRHTLLRCSSCGGLQTFPRLEETDVVHASWSAPYDGAAYLPARFATALARLATLCARGLLRGGRVSIEGSGARLLALAARAVGVQASSDRVHPRHCAVPPYGPSLSAGTIVSLYTLERALDVAAEVKRLRSQVLPGGRLVLLLSNAGSAQAEAVASRRAAPPVLALRALTEGGVRRLLNSLGLEVQQTWFFERWDANRVADVLAPEVFGAAERLARLAPWSVAMPLIAARFGALAASLAIRPVVEPSQLSELAVVAREAGR